MDSIRVPFEPGPLFGRTLELEKIREALSHPLVTLVGPGGVGKTRLALRLANEHQDIAFCEFASASNRTELLQAIADALGYSNAELTIEKLATEMSSKGTTHLIFDNAEHLLSDVAQLASEFLKSHVRIIVTSREPLKLRAEYVVKIHPFDTEEGTSFLKFYADSRKPTWAPLLESNAEVVTEIVERLDGLALALELVVGQLGTAEPAVILENLREGHSDDRRDRESRHATLHSMLTRSWDLLSDDERRALVQLSSFVDLFSRDAAVDVVEVGERTEDVLARLVEKSLIRFQKEHDGSFYMYKTVRDFVERVQGFDDVFAKAHRRHAEHLLSGGSVLNDARLVFALRNDAIAAFNRFKVADPDLAGRLVFRAAHALDSRIEYRTIIRLVEAALELPLTDPELVVVLTMTKAVCFSRLGRVHDAIEFLENVEGIELLSPGQLANFHDAKAEIQRSLARYDDAYAELQRALVAAELQDDPWLEAVILGHVAIAAWSAGKNEEAKEFHQRFSRSVKIKSPEWPELAPYPDLLAAEIAFDSGDVEQAQSHYDAALKYSSSGKRYDYQMQTLNGWLHHHRGEIEAAKKIWWEVASHDSDETAKYSIAALWALSFANEPDAIDRIDGVVAVGQDYLNAARLRLFEALDFAELGEFQRAQKTIESAQTAAQKLQVPALAGLIALLTDILSEKDATLLVGASLFEISESVVWTSGGAASFLTEVMEVLPSSLPGFVRWRGADVGDLLRRVIAIHVKRERSRKPERVLWVSQSGEQVTLPGGKQIDFAGRVAESRIILALAKNWATQTSISRDAMVEVGWPGEFVEESAGASRVYTAVKSIRKRGLEKFLITTDGYQFDPETVVMVRP